LPSIAPAKAANLKLLEERDAGELYALIEANRDHLAPWMAWAQNPSEADTLEFIRASRRQLDARTGLQMALLDGPRIAGVVGFHTVDWPNRCASIGYWLSRERQGEGRMTAAVRTLVEHAFGALELHRVELRADVVNARSRAIADRLGFREEGTLRGAALVGGRFVDHVVYGMLACEWVTARGRWPKA
jgi:ribosomal-protein-serine acetyltransferase